jgi:hypothetical protein
MRTCELLTQFSGFEDTLKTIVNGAPIFQTLFKGEWRLLGCYAVWLL